MRLTNPILFGALALPIIPTVYSTTFAFYIPMELSNSDGVNFTSIIGKGNADSNQYELKYSDSAIASYDDNRFCFDKSDSAPGQPGVPMQQNQTGVCDDLPRYEGIADISFEASTSEPQSLKISMPEYEVFVSYQANTLGELG
jgi:hypothetical protein